MLTGWRRTAGRTGHVVERLALVSSERGLRLDPDLSLASAALEEAGIPVDVVRWDDPAVDWSAYALAVVRSCWDYSWRLEEFLGWAAGVPRLRNSLEILRWNTDKVYLRDVARAGLPVVPTVWNPATAGELPEAGEWVVKPSISAGSRDTARWSDPGAALAHVAELTAAGRTAMLQPYLPSVDEAGGPALLFRGGRSPPAARRAPLLQRGEGVRQAGDSRGAPRPVEPTTRQRDAAQSVLDAVAALVPGAAPPLYA